MKGVADADKDLCLIAPQSLVRPVRYKRYFRRGVTIPPYLPTSKVKGELKEVSVPDPCSPDELRDMVISGKQKETRGYQFRDVSDLNKPYVISNNIYIEHHGKFTKAPQHLLELNDYDTRVCYLEDVVGPQFESPLDVAILLQKIWSLLAKVMFGILAGILFIATTTVMTLMPNAEANDLGTFMTTFPRVCVSFYIFISVLSILVLIALFDWLDLGHMNLQHLWDTYLHRTVWLIAVPFLIAYMLFLSDGELNDALYLHGADWTDWILREALIIRIEDNLSFRRALHLWQLKLLVSAVLVMCGWILLVITRNDDLFLLHLECMKKYDIRPVDIGPKQKSANPRFVPA